MTEIEWLDIFSTNLKEIMDEQGYTQKDLAESTGLSEPSISTYVKGTRMPGIKALVNMSLELGISMEDFIVFGDRIE